MLSVRAIAWLEKRERNVPTPRPCKFAATGLAQQLVTVSVETAAFSELKELDQHLCPMCERLLFDRPLSYRIVVIPNG